jgi:hypothetical protein
LIVCDRPMKQIRLILLALATAFPLVDGRAAMAQTPAQTSSFEEAATLLAASCGKDIDTNCRGVNLDPTRLKDCLARNQDVVSPTCKADYPKAFAAIQQRVAARGAVAKACERDAPKFCAEAQGEPGKTLACLASAPSGPRGVSAKCSQAIGAAGYR